MANQNVTKILGIGVIGIGVWLLYRAYSNIIDYPEAFSDGNGIGAGESYDLAVVLPTIFFAVGGVALILYAIRRIRETKQKRQTNPST